MTKLNMQKEDFDSYKESSFKCKLNMRKDYYYPYKVSEGDEGDSNMNWNLEADFGTNSCIEMYILLFLLLLMPVCLFIIVTIYGYGFLVAQFAFLKALF